MKLSTLPLALTLCLTALTTVPTPVVYGQEQAPPAAIDGTTEEKIQAPEFLWTDPKYAVKPIKKELPARKAKVEEPVVLPAPVDTFDADAKAFADSVGSLQYLWRATQKTSSKQSEQKLLAELSPSEKVKAISPMEGYNKDLSARLLSQLSVPTQASLVETEKRKYTYLFTFTLNKNGKISNFKVENQIGSVTSTMLADDTESNLVISSVKTAISKCLPLARPSVGLAPWYMAMQYDLNKGQLLLCCLNQK
jgi:hypothetical protein